MEGKKEPSQLLLQEQLRGKEPSMYIQRALKDIVNSNDVVRPARISLTGRYTKRR